MFTINGLKRGAVLLIGMAMVLPAVAFASSDTVVARINEDTDRANAYIDSFDGKSGEEVLATMKDAGQVLAGQFRESSKFYYDEATNESDADSHAHLVALGLAASNLAFSLDEQKQSIVNSDTALYEKAHTDYDKYIDDFNKAASDYGDSKGIGFEEDLYGVSFVIFLIISVVLGLMIIGKPLLPADKMAKQAKKQLFAASLYPLIGSLVTLVWYELTPPGGTYFILWGPMIVGTYYLLQAIYVYITKAMPKIKALRKDQESKLADMLQASEA